jgi:hypothetical protein
MSSIDSNKQFSFAGSLFARSLKGYQLYIIISPCDDD